MLYYAGLQYKNALASPACTKNKRAISENAQNHVVRGIDVKYSNGR
ncbi:hypothetical protein V6C21_09840 [[Clostridium] cellulosi]